jgi:hypothetical protein
MKPRVLKDKTPDLTKKRGRLDKLFPAHYYKVNPEGITRKQLDEVVVDQWSYMQEKVASSIDNLLHKRVDPDLIMQAMSGAYAACVNHLEKNPAKWPWMDEFFSYWLVSSWREFRDQGLREQKHWGSLVPLDAGDFYEYRGQNLKAPVPEEAGLQDFLGQEEFTTFVHERVYDYLDDCLLDGVFTMREVSIFKIYCVNNYSIERMAADTQFSRTRIITALSKIKKHLATVDFRWYQFHPNLHP